MPLLKDHLDQVNKNIKFLGFLSQSNDTEYLDWKVTVCFYTGLHIINAYLASHSLQYRKHKEVFDVISFTNTTSAVSLEEPIYMAYRKLSNLSRLSRYLTSSSDKSDTTATSISSGKYAKAIKNLEILLVYFSNKLDYKFDTCCIDCLEIIEEDLQHFSIAN